MAEADWFEVGRGERGKVPDQWGPQLGVVQDSSNVAQNCQAYFLSHAVAQS
jgi:hypothetical protein